MKALSVSQPWASVIAAGLKDVENRSWETPKAPGRILIHATKTPVQEKFEDAPSEKISVVKNARIFGQIPEYKDMPYGAVIGYVNCYEITTDSDSLWAQDNCFHWCLKGAYLFDSPVKCPEGARGSLFDVPEIDENNLPASHKVKLVYPECNGDVLTLPLCDSLFAAVKAKKTDHISLELTGEIEQLLLKPGTNESRNIKTIKFVLHSDPAQSIVKGFDGTEFTEIMDDFDNAIPLEEYPGEGIYWTTVDIYFK